MHICLAFTLHSFKSPSSVHFSLSESENEKTNNNNNDNNIDNSKEEQHLSVKRGVKTEGMKSLVCMWVCVWLFLHQSSLEACSPSWHVFGPSCGWCCVLLGGREEQRWVLVVCGRQTEGDLQSTKSLSSLQEGTARLEKPGSSSWTPVRSPVCITAKAHLFCTHSPDVSVLTNTCTISPRHPCWSLGGSFFSISLLLGPAQIALHLHKLGGVLLLLLNFMLLKLQLQEYRCWRKRRKKITLYKLKRWQSVNRNIYKIHAGCGVQARDQWLVFYCILCKITKYYTLLQSFTCSSFCCLFMSSISRSLLFLWASCSSFWALRICSLFRFSRTFWSSGLFWGARPLNKKIKT